MESSSQGIVILRAIRDASGRVTDFLWVYTNDSTQRALKTDKAQLNGARLLTLMPGIREEGLFDAYIHVVDTGAPLHKEHHYTHDGLDHWFDVWAIKVGENVCLTFSDIGAPYETDRFARAIVSALPYSIAILDDRGFILAVNDAWRKFGIENGVDPAHSDVGANYIDLCDKVQGLTKQTALEMAQGIRDVISGQAQECTIEYPCHSAIQERWFLGRVNRFSVEGPVRVLVCHENITQRMIVENQLRHAMIAAEQASQAKSQFLANMSHEIRTPMTAILGYAGMLQHMWEKGAARSECTEIFGIIRRNADQLLAVINDVLDVAQIESGQMVVELVRTPVLEIVDQVVESQRPAALAKGLILTLVYETPVPATIKSDPHRLRQILEYLISNAIKFTHQGAVTVSLAASAASGVSHSLVIKIIDTGIGISVEDQANLFQVFQQADASHTRKYGGIGLGLRISKRLSKLLSGDILVQSTPGVGSTFSLVLPAPEDAQIPSVSTPAQAPAPPRPLSPDAAQQDSKPLADTRVLVVEDNIDNQRLFASLLRADGAQVDVAGDGKIAVDLLTTQSPSGTTLVPQVPYHLILMDLQMPVLNGYEATQQLRALGLTTPILAISAQSQRDDRGQCVNAGFDDYVSKPIDPDSLLALCAQWVGVGLARQSMGQNDHAPPAP